MLEGLLAFIVCHAKRAGGELEELRFSNDDPPRVRRRLLPIYLRSLYLGLEECVATIARTLVRYNMVTHVDTSVFRCSFGSALCPCHLNQSSTLLRF